MDVEKGEEKTLGEPSRIKTYRLGDIKYKTGYAENPLLLAAQYHFE